ncbi:MAG: hypothetical protein V3W19_17590, partial [Desulfatiglandales bacterium]
VSTSSHRVAQDRGVSIVQSSCPQLLTAYRLLLTIINRPGSERGSPGTLGRVLLPLTAYCLLLTAYYN